MQNSYSSCAFQASVPKEWDQLPLSLHISDLFLIGFQAHGYLTSSSPGSWLYSLQFHISVCDCVCVRHLINNNNYSSIENYQWRQSGLKSGSWIQVKKIDFSPRLLCPKSGGCDPPPPGLTPLIIIISIVATVTIIVVVIIIIMSHLNDLLCFIKYLRNARKFS